MKRFMCLPAAVIAFLLLISYRQASAHGHTHVGDYELVIGFQDEPAYQGEPNGLDLFVTNVNTEERVNGLEETLKVEIIFGASRRELALRPQFGQDGAYTADVLPTEAGDYTWRIFGTIEGMPVDISMTSGPDTFSPVQPKSNVAFPENEPSTAEILAQSADLANSVRVATIMGAAALAFGLIGIIVGLLALRTARRRAVS